MLIFFTRFSLLYDVSLRKAPSEKPSENVLDTRIYLRPESQGFFDVATDVFEIAATKFRSIQGPSTEHEDAKAGSESVAALTP